MDPGDDAYTILGVEETATLAEIKKAYRKLALQHHPDRNGENHHHVFAKISNAYEILSDTNKRAEYDQARAYGFQYDDTPVGDQEQDYDPHHRSTARGSRHHDDNRRRPPPPHPHDFFNHFHDPFEIFEQFFQHEFGPPPHGGNGMFGRGGGHRPSPFDDPFFRSPFGGGDFLFGGPSLFGGGPIFPPPPPHHHHHQFHPDPFFASARSMMHPNDLFHQGNVMTATSTSSFGGLGGGGSSVSTSTTTRIINGRRETVTERVVRHADGRVERTVQRLDGTSTTTTDRLTNQDVPAHANDTHTNGALPSSSTISSRSGQTRPRSSDSHSQNIQPIIDLTGEEDEGAAAIPYSSHRRSSPTTTTSTRHQDKKTKRGSHRSSSGTDGNSPRKFWKS